jgi:hypothetical protein
LDLIAMPFQEPIASTAFPEETRVEIVPLDEMTMPVVTQGIAYWQHLRGDRPYPAREDIRIRDIPGLLKHMVVAKVLDGGADFALNIVGDEVCRCYRALLIHRRMSETFADLPNTVQRWLPIYRRVALSGVPIAVVVTVGLEMPEVNFTHAETVCLPFGPTGGAPDYIATFGQHTSRSGFSRT